MPALFSNNLYAVLGIDSTATHDEVRKAYRKRVLETHPDKLDPALTEEEKQAAQEQFRLVHDAFEVLGCDYKRKAYDIRIKHRSYTSPAQLSQLSPSATKRLDERMQWARRQSDGRQRYHSAFFAEVEREKQAVERERLRKQAAKEKLEMQARMAEEMLKEMYRASGEEVRERREAAAKRKAERERERAQAAKQTPSSRPARV